MGGQSARKQSRAGVRVDCFRRAKARKIRGREQLSYDLRLQEDQGHTQDYAGDKPMEQQMCPLRKCAVDMSRRQRYYNMEAKHAACRVLAPPL